ncbi:MAG: ATP-dependent zinc metalloprotease FtsH [Actinobacteria bacterium]|nr:ATP-dependent zinc metalloprotease FtsH [Actinomycetota bacterium]MCL6088418.1 ATP-dependent zinc metalloprotease FtsH [Actinomycetota bacterium]
MFFIFRNPLFLAPQIRDLNLTEFIAKVNQNEIDTNSPLVIKGDDKLIEGQLKDNSKFRVSFLADYDISKFLIDKNIPFKVDNQKQSIWIQILVGALPFLIMFGLIFFLFNQMQGGGSKVMQFGKSRARIAGKGKNKVTFKDVAGVDEAVEELKEIEEFLENPGKFKAMGAKIPKGVLLYGPPGTGKTLLARAVAGEAGVPFYSISGSEFVEMFVGVGASRVRDLFAQAKATQPSIIFMDEIDAVGRHRGAGLGGGHDEREQTLNQLLVEMDGFDADSTVILIAATNRPDILDPALLRPGRFDRQIMVDRPDLVGREKILEVHGRGKPLDRDVIFKTIAKQTPGFTGADLANLFNEASLLAARHNKKKISMFEIEQAVERVIAGPEKKARVISEKEKRIIAYHEAGHALLAYILPNTDPVYKISIISRGRALGYTITLPEEDRFLKSKTEILDNIKMLLGGRVAEAIVFNDITSGAENDIDRATKLTRQMVTDFGMSDKLGPVAFKGEADEVFLGNQLISRPHYSDKIASVIDDEVHQIIENSYNDARELLIQNDAILKELSEKLIEKETLNKEEVVEILGKLNIKKSEGFKSVENKQEKPGRTKKSPKTSVAEPVTAAGKESLKKDSH